MRRLTRIGGSALATEWHFAPTMAARRKLLLPDVSDWEHPAEQLDATPFAPTVPTALAHKRATALSFRADERREEVRGNREQDQPFTHGVDSIPLRLRCRRRPSPNAATSNLSLCRLEGARFVKRVFPEATPTVGPAGSPSPAWSELASWMAPVKPLSAGETPGLRHPPLSPMPRLVRCNLVRRANGTI